MHDQMDVAAGMFTRTRTQCSLQGIHVLHACLDGWLARLSRHYFPGHRPLGSKDAPLLASPSASMPAGKLLSTSVLCDVL